MLVYTTIDFPGKKVVMKWKKSQLIEVAADLFFFTKYVIFIVMNHLFSRIENKNANYRSKHLIKSSILLVALGFPFPI